MDDPSESAMWTRPNPAIHDWMPGMVHYALTVDGYGYAQKHLVRAAEADPHAVTDLGDFAKSRLEEYRATGTWRGTFEELRVCLFFEQRRWRHGDERPPEGEQWTMLQALHKAICDAWDREADVIHFRAPKDPRDLKILDPACGSGHFLLYAFDLLATIYEEAWADDRCPASAATGARLRDDYPDLDALRRAVPGLILRHNLHGVDIDPRACQIAALALWLRAQRAYQALGLRPADRPPITRSQIVCAEPMPGERDLLDEYLNRHVDPRLHDLVRVIWDKMRLAGEAGTLLKIEEAIAAELAQARDRAMVDVPPVQVSLFQRDSPVVQSRMTFATDDDRAFWNDAEAKLLAALRDYASQAAGAHATQRRLFAGDAAQGFAFIDLCRQRFDVVLMNPPFGEPSGPSKSYIEDAYPRTKNDVYAAFTERWIGKLDARGRLGAITSRTGFFLTSFRRWREEILLRDAPPVVVADLGYGVLDSAMVETAAYVLERAQ